MDEQNKGRRKDGKPFKEGNVAPDGSFLVGKNRTPVSTRFAEGDGRKRGRRPKGVKNFDSDWEAELTSMVPIVENGKRKRVTRHHAQVKKTMQAGAQGDIRAQQIIYAKSERLGQASEKKSTVSDDLIIEEWLTQMAATANAAGSGIIGDDLRRKNVGPELAGQGTDHSGDGEHDDDHK